VPPRFLPQSKPLAFFSDLHGNLAAFDAVLAELDRQGVETFFAAGDLLLGGDDPVGVFKRLQQRGVHCVRGPSDVALVELDPDVLKAANEEQAARLEVFAETRRSLGELALRTLSQLPDTIRIPLVDGREILVVHGSPADATVEMSHDLDDAELNALIADDPADFVICGGTHVPFQRDVEGVRIINVGSVGEAPEGRNAHYTVLTPRIEGTLVEQGFVEY
jgi:predicted phosphodiesterase